MHGPSKNIFIPAILLLFSICLANSDFEYLLSKVSKRHDPTQAILNIEDSACGTFNVEFSKEANDSIRVWLSQEIPIYNGCHIPGVFPLDSLSLLEYNRYLKYVAFLDSVKKDDLSYVNTMVRDSLKRKISYGMQYQEVLEILGNDWKRSELMMFWDCHQGGCESIDYKNCTLFFDRHKLRYISIHNRQ
jgi:hypothetical protein